jgi:hypothetical protein
MKIVLQDAQEVNVSNVTREIRYISGVPKELMIITTTPSVLGATTFEQLVTIFNKDNVVQVTVVNDAGDQLLVNTNMNEITGIAQSFTEDEQVITVRLSE